MPERPQNKHLKPNPQTLPNVKLEPGEISKAVKIRGPQEVVDWFTTLDWRERMRLVERLYAERERTTSARVERGLT
jgi:hypothetical protein